MSRRPAPWPHQVEDIATLCARPAHFLGLYPGAGKSRIVVEAAFRLAAAGEIDQLLVVCPAPGRSVWADPDPVLGEFVKWAPSSDYELHEYLGTLPPPRQRRLQVLVTNPERLRMGLKIVPRKGAQPGPHLHRLLLWAARGRTFLVVDESWQYQNPEAAQTMALYLLRQACARVALLNGTPGEPMQLFAQYQILDRAILGCANRFQFRGRYCELGGFMKKEIVGYKNLDDFQGRTAPYTTIRHDNPAPGAEPIRTQIEAPLTPATWQVYRQMEREMLAWLDVATVATASQAGVRAMRLAQIANGFVGGLEDPDGEGLLSTLPGAETREIGNEKLTTLLTWLRTGWVPQDKLVIFTKFRPDVERTAVALATAFPQHEVCRVYGTQDLNERHRAKQLLAPGGDPAPAIVVANAVSGGAMLNFAAASLCVFLGNDYPLRVREQAERRVNRPGQQRRPCFLDVLATGPKGERTIDHVIAGALRRQESLQAWSPDAWRAALAREE